MGRPEASVSRCLTSVSIDAFRYMHTDLSFTISEHSGVITVPPPNAITIRCCKDGETVLPLCSQREGPVACNGRDCFSVLTVPDGVRMELRVSASSFRNSVSPSEANISGMLLPALPHIASSRSMKGQQSSSERYLPTLLLPHPINPVNVIIIRTSLTVRHQEVPDR